MRIYYPTRSRFLKPCEDAVRQNNDALLTGAPISVKFSPQGYNGKIRVNIEKINPTTFWAAWESSDPTRFPVRIKAAAYALLRMGVYGEFVISHETGILTIRYLSPSSDVLDDSKERVELPDPQKKDKIVKRYNEPPVVDENIELKGDMNSSTEDSQDMSKDPRVKLLLEFGATIRPQELFPVLHEGAASLIEENPFAFALAAVLDRGTKADIIWTVPYYLQAKIGELTPRFFASKPLEDLQRIFRDLPLKPRYIGDAPRTVKELSEMVLREFDCDVTKIWRNKTSTYVKATFQRIYGVGPGIASMIVLLLERCLRVQFTDIDHRNMDVKPDVHIVRVFHRLGFVSVSNETEALKAARRLNPEYPGALDPPSWIIGKKWCAPFAPQCPHCPVNEVCPKNIISDK